MKGMKKKIILEFKNTKEQKMFWDWFWMVKNNSPVSFVIGHD